MSKCGTITPIRIWIGILILFGAFVTYMLRVNVSVAVIDLIDGKRFFAGLDEGCNFTYQNEYPSFNNMADISAKFKPMSPLILAFVFSMYNTGYLFSILISKMFAEKWGATRVVGYCTILAAFLTILTPATYYIGVFVLFSARFLIGFVSGFMFPLLHIVIAEWSPKNEKSIFALTLYGASFGMIATFPFSGFILKNLSWSWILYITGIIAIGWSFIWLAFVTDMAEEHPCITEAEIAKISFRRDTISVYFNMGNKVPWQRIITSLPMKALFILLWGNTWNLSFYIDYMPILLYYVLGFDVMTASTLSCLPILARMLFSWICMFIEKCLATQCKSYIGLIRKFFTIFSHIIPAAIQIIMVTDFYDRDTITIHIILYLGFSGAIVSGGLSNTTDLTPHYAANIHTIMQGSLCMASIIMPFVVAFVLFFYHCALGWKIILTINSIVYLVGGIVFLIYGSGNVQSFDSARLNSVQNHTSTFSLETVRHRARNESLS